jgi:hypothetical protein
MSTYLQLDTETRSLIQGCMDDLVEIFGRPCTLVYPARMTPCENCVYDTVTQLSSNRWRSGGPIPFPNSTACPQCNGKGFAATEVSETLTFICETDPKKFIAPFNKLALTVPAGYLQIKGRLTDIPKVERAEFLLYQIDKRYVRVGEALDHFNLVPNRYFHCLFERRG